MYKILDIFSGAGGFSYGMEMNNKFKTVLALDFEKKVKDTFEYNHPGAKIVIGDITNKNTKSSLIEEAKDMGVNMIIGGPPCQGFSLKGKKLGLDDPRNFLFMEYLDIVKQVKPEIFIMENVKAMVSSSDGFFIKEITKKFGDIGYEVSYDVLNSKSFGVPQRRERAIIIGSLNKKYKLPKGNTKHVLVSDAISDLSYLDSGEKSDGTYSKPAETKYQKQMRKGSKMLNSHFATSHSAEAIKRMKIIPEKGNKFDLPESMRTKQKFNTTWSRLHWDNSSPTIDTRFDTPSNGQNIHPVLHRAITPREAARIQSFPDKFHFIGNKTAICRQIGNAVPPLMAKAIADSIDKQNAVVDESFGDDITIVNGDAFSVDLKNIKTIDAVITDPPYNIAKKNNFNTMGNRKGIDFGEWDKGFDLTGWIKRYYSKLKPGGTIIIFSSYLWMSKITDHLTEIGADVKDLIKWTKTNPMPRNRDRRYVTDTEFAVWAVKPGKWTFNRGDATYLRAQFSSSTVSGKERTKHPTQKSLKLMKELIEIHTNKGDLVVDPFMGSGTTGVAAAQLQRKFFGVELDKGYYEISKDRITK